MKRSQAILYILLFLLFHNGLKAQEVAIPLSENREAAEYYRHFSAKKATNADTLELPFREDFSTSSVQPDPAKWTDRDVFVNNTYCINPVTNGVATLDAFDYSGSIYPGATLSPRTFVADVLSSRPINLDFPPGDSIYLSFYYQPEGYGDIPDDSDSLMLDFYETDLSRWVNVWRTGGTALHEFRQVLIPVTGEQFLKKGFRFRFRNRASLPSNPHYPDKRGNVDHWNVDYIRLDRYRSASDSILRDVAFTTSLNSVLNDFSALPWSHFETAYNTTLDPYIFARYGNNDSITRNITRSLIFEEPWYGDSFNPGAPTAQDLEAGSDTIVQFDTYYPLDFDRGDSALIRYTASLRTDEFDPKDNDTVVFDQFFGDYYAYDDGTAEAGIGIRGQGSANSSMAVKYHSFIPDQLGGVRISFNQLYDSLNLGYYFKLIVWDDNNGVPGSIIWEDEKDYTPVYSEEFPGFVSYYFTSPVPVDGPFYVGWRQYSEYLLNVGLDLNTTLSSQVRFYIDYKGQWVESDIPGVMMLRPFLYDESTSIQDPGKATREFRVYPNPSSGIIRLQLQPDQLSGNSLVEIFDAGGRRVLTRNISAPSLDTGHLPDGLYIIRVSTGKALYYSKLMIRN